MSFTKIDHYEKEYVDHHHDSALSVTEGVADQPIVNPYFVRKKKHRLSTEEYVKGILEGNITTLSQAITLIESSNPDHYAQAQEIIERCLPHAGRSVRIGITGVPGAGKSTFIEAIGNMVTSLHHKLAVLAIDPSSEAAAVRSWVIRRVWRASRPTPTSSSVLHRRPVRWAAWHARRARRSCCARRRAST